MLRRKQKFNVTSLSMIRRFCENLYHLYGGVGAQALRWDVEDAIPYKCCLLRVRYLCKIIRHLYGGAGAQALRVGRLTGGGTPRRRGSGDTSRRHSAIVTFCKLINFKMLV